MARQCTICNHPDRAAIEVALGTETSNRGIAAGYGVSEASLRRHLKSHVTHLHEATQAPSMADRAHVDRKRVRGQHIPPDIKPELQEQFLAQFVLLANEIGACRVVKIGRATVRGWEEKDETFSFRYQEAKEQVNDDIRAEIYRRAVTGYDDLIVTPKGESFEVTRYSDRLLEFLAKARMRHEFGDKAAVDLTSNGQTVGQGVTLDQLAAMIHQAPQELSHWEREHDYDDDDLSSH
jgi:hypothetical protein